MDSSKDLAAAGVEAALLQNFQFGESPGSAAPVIHGVGAS